MPSPVDFDRVILEDIKLYFDFYAKIKLTLHPRQPWVEILFEWNIRFFNIPYRREQKHVSVSDMSRLEAPASWPRLPVS